MIADKTICDALSALRQFVVKQKEARSSKELFEEPENQALFLQITLKKIPFLSHLKIHKIALQHPFLSDMKEVCLLTSDLDRKTPNDQQTKKHFSELLESKGVSVGEIIPYHQLRTEYKTFEARRYLSREFEVFLSEGSLSKMLPNALGKYFVSKRKMPISVSLRADKVQSEIKRALSKTTLNLTGRGSSCAVKVGTLNQSDVELASNVQSVAKYLNERMPGQWTNVYSVYLKTSLSIALPIYISTESKNDVMLPRNEGNPEPVEDEVNTLTRSRIKIFPSGKFALVRAETDDIHNEYGDVEKKALNKMRQVARKKQMGAELKKLKIVNPKKKRKMLRREMLQKKKVPKESSKPQSGPTGKSIFGLPLVLGRRTKKASEALKSTTGSDLPAASQELQNSSPALPTTLDKTFDDSFSRHSRRIKKPHSMTKLSQSTDAKDVTDANGENNKEVQEDKSSRKRIRLTASKRSYSMADDKGKKPSQDAQLLRYAKKKFEASPDSKSPIKETEGTVSVGKLKRRVSEIKNANSEKKLSRFASLRQSARLAKQLL